MIKSANIGGLFIAAAIAAFCSTIASAQAADSWLTVRSKSFTVTSNASEADSRAAAKRLEDFRWAFGQLYPQLKLDNGKPANIVLFKDAASYYSFLPKRPDGSIDEGVAGYFQAGEDVNYITLAAASGQADPLSTIVHEYVHSVVNANFESIAIPPWLNEGLAEYFETARIESGKTIVVGSEQWVHLRLLRRTGLIALPEFFAVDAANLRTMTPERRRQFYAQSWLVVELLAGSGKLKISNLGQTLSMLSAQNASVAEVLELDQLLFEQRLQLSLQRRSLPHFSINTQSFLPTDESVIVTAMSTAQATAVLGDLLFHTGDLVRAETLLRQAIALDQSPLLANTSLGLLLMRQAKPAEAKAFLEKAIKAGSANYQVHFCYAYAVSQEFTKDGAIATLPDDAAQSMRTALEKAIELDPSFVDSYRLLALVDFIRDEKLDEAVEILERGLQFKKDDNDLKLLLARVFLRRGDAITARKIAEQISATGGPKLKADADEIVANAYEFTQAKQTAPSPNKLTLSVSRLQGIAVLKRSWLTEAEVRRIDDERVNNNLNRLIIRARTGENQIVGRIERISCNGGDINYFIKAGSDQVALKSADFANIKMTVAQEGESSFSIGCGARLEKNLAVINFRPSTSAKSTGELVAISFVPDSFRLKSAIEMMAARMIAIDDDTLRRSGPPTEVNSDTIRRSVTASLRKPRKGEMREIGKIESIECVDGKTILRVSVGDRKLALQTRQQEEPSVTWFTVTSTQLLLECGSGPIEASAIFTFMPTEGKTGSDGELHSIEFVPDGYVLSD